MEKHIETITERYCTLLNISSEQMKRRSQRNDDVKPMFAAIILLRAYPGIFEIDSPGMPYGMGTSIAGVLGVNRQQASAICHKAHSYYRIYKIFKEKVDQLNKEI